MKVVVNKCYGGAKVEDWVSRYLNIDPWDFDRTDSRLIALIEEYGDTCSGTSSALCILDIPDDATDWQIWDYDGAETVIWVQNGKMHTDFELGAD